MILSIMALDRIICELRKQFFENLLGADLAFAFGIVAVGLKGLGETRSL